MGESIRPFNPEGEDVGMRWGRWMERFELYLQVKEVKVESKMVHLLYYAGEYVHEKYIPLKKVEDDYAAVVATLNGVFNPPVNKQMNVFRFQNMRQFEGEPIDEFVSRLRGTVNTCGFATGHEESQLKSQIIQGCLSENLRRNALEKENLSLEELLKMGKIGESVANFMKASSSFATTALLRTPAQEFVNQVETENKNKIFFE